MKETAMSLKRTLFVLLCVISEIDIMDYNWTFAKAQQDTEYRSQDAG